MVRTPYRVAVRLYGILIAYWSELTAAYYQIDLLQQRPHRTLTLVYAWCMERTDPEKREEFLQDLNDLLPWEESDSEAAAEIESASFMAMMAQQQQ